MKAASAPTDGQRRGRRTNRAHRRAALLLAGLSVLVMGAAAASAESNLFPGAARPDLGEGISAVGSGGRMRVSIPSGGLVPGGTANAEHVLANAAGVPLRYSLLSKSANADRRGLRDLILVTITTPDVTSGGVTASCDDPDATTLYDGPLGASAAGFGNPSLGAHPGDRELGAGGRVTLCFELTMPLKVGNDHQGATTSTSWTLASEQVSGNS